MWELSNILLGGILTGAIYAMLGVGISLIFRVSGVLNLAQGAFVTCGALVMYSFTYSVGMPLALAFLASIGVMAVIAGIVASVIVRPAMSRISHSSLLMLMGGMLISFQGAAFLIWGSNPYSLQSFSGNKPLQLGGLNIPTQAFWIIGALVLSVTTLWWFLSRTRYGKALRGASENMDAARLMGVPVDRMIVFSFMASAVLGVLAGAMVAPLTSLAYSSMADYTNQGVIAVSLGGLGSLFGPVAGGLVLGVGQGLLSGYVSSLWSTALSLLLLMAIMVWRPQGVLGRTMGTRRDVAERPLGAVYAPPKLPRTWLRAGALVVAVVMLLMPTMLGPNGDLRAVNIIGIFCLTIVGLDLLTGIAGQVSLGQAGFMAIGGYMMGILTVHYHVPPLVALLAGAVGTALVAAVLGLLSARLQGMYLAVVTLAFGILVENLANGLSITGGPNGIAGIPPFSVFGYSFESDTSFFYLIWGLVAVALILVVNLVRSNRGRILRAMHGDDTGAQALGLNITRAKVTVFVISAVIASVAGSLYASYFAYLSPDQVGSAESLQIMTMLVVGGMGTLFGPLLGVALLTYLPEVSQSIANYAPLIDGALLVAFMRFLPGGIYGGFLNLVSKAHSRLRLGRDAPILTTANDGTIPHAALNGNSRSSSWVRHLKSRFTPQAPAARPEAPEKNRGKGPDGLGGTSRRSPSPERPLLRVQELEKAFGGVSALRGVSFDVFDGSIHALIGPNGSGKSTLLNLVTNLYKPDGGTVYLGDRCITEMRPDEVTSLGIFRTFQTSRIFPQLTVMENVLIGGYRLGRSGHAAQALRLPKTRREEFILADRAGKLLEVVGLEPWRDAPSHVLPLAGQKHVELARALMSRPRILLLDEPGAGMNAAETAELGVMLRAIRELGHTILVIEHNMNLVMNIADQVAVMDAGVLIANGPPEAIRHDQAVIGAYFG